VHVVEQIDRLDLGETTFKHIGDPIACAIRLDDGTCTNSRTTWRRIPSRCPNNGIDAAGSRAVRIIESRQVGVPLEALLFVDRYV
jgi:hypothetical protein